MVGGVAIQRIPACFIRISVAAFAACLDGDRLLTARAIKGGCCAVIHLGIPVALLWVAAAAAS